MRKNRRTVWLCAAVAVFFLALMIFSVILSSDGSRYSCRVEEDLFSLDMDSFSGTGAETFYLREGDSIDVSAVRISGELSIVIGQVGRQPVYEGNGRGPDSFRVTIQEDGNYLISVSGRHAEGSISFQIKRAAAELRHL